MEEKGLIFNWFNPNTAIGGCETFFSQLIKNLNADFIDVPTLMKITQLPLSMDYYKGANVDRMILLQSYLKKRLIFDKPKYLLSNAEAQGWPLNDVEIPRLAIFQNPYVQIEEYMKKNNIPGFQAEHYFEYYHQVSQQQANALKKATVSVTVSNCMREYAKRIDATVDHVIPHGVNTDFFSPILDKEMVRKKWGFPLDKPIGLVITKFHPNKYHLFPYLNKVLGEGVYWIVLFANPVNDFPRGDNVRVFWDGNPHEVREFYAAADFHLSPSFFESFGLTHLESASMGLPTIGTDTGLMWDLKQGKSEEVSKGVFKHVLGYTTDISVESLASAVRNVLGEINVGNKVRRDFVVDKYNINDMISSYKKLIKKHF